MAKIAEGRGVEEPEAWRIGNFLKVANSGVGGDFDFGISCNAIKLGSLFCFITYICDLILQPDLVYPIAQIK